MHYCSMLCRWCRRSCPSQYRPHLSGDAGARSHHHRHRRVDAWNDGNSARRHASLPNLAPIADAGGAADVPNAHFGAAAGPVRSPRIECAGSRGVRRWCHRGVSQGMHRGLFATGRSAHRRTHTRCALIPNAAPPTRETLLFFLERGSVLINMRAWLLFAFLILWGLAGCLSRCAATVVTPLNLETLEESILRVPRRALGGIYINETDAMALNVSQYDFTIMNALADLDHDLCLNKGLIIGAANVVDNMVECPIADVAAGNCSALGRAAVESALAVGGWTSTGYMGAAHATKLPAHYFNWSSPYAYGGEGLFGREAFEAAMLVVPEMERVFRSALTSGRYKFIASYTAQMLNDEIYTYVILGSDPSQHCYSAGA